MYDTTLYRLKVFTLIVEHGSVGAAANALGVSQPSVSTHVRGLESLVGQLLFDRKPGRPLELTDAGRVLYNYAHETVLAADNVMDVLRDFEVGRRGRAAIAATRGLVHDALIPLLVEHRRRAPSVLVSVQSGTLAQVLQLVETGAASFGLVTARETVGTLRSHLLCPVPLLVIASPDHHLAARKHLTPEELANEPWIIPDRSSSHYKLTLGVLRRVGYRIRDIAFEVDDGTAMSALVRTTDALAVALETGVRRELALKELVALSVEPALPALELRLVARPKRQFTHAEGQLARLIAEMLGDASDTSQLSELTPFIQA